MYSVTTQKLRSGGRAPKRRRLHHGYLLSTPVVGSSLVMFREDTGTRMVTTEVVRILTSDRTLFVETENSLYRIAVHSRVVFQDRRQRFIPIATGELSLSIEEEPLTSDAHG